MKSLAVTPGLSVFLEMRSLAATASWSEKLMFLPGILSRSGRTQARVSACMLGPELYRM